MLGQDGERTGHIDADGRVALFWDTDQAVDLAALRGVLNLDRTEAWSQVTIGGNESFDGIWLHLTATEPGTCRIAAERTAIDTKLCTPAIPSLSPALVEGDSLAYFTLRPHGEDGEERRWELGSATVQPVRNSLSASASRSAGGDQDRTAQPVVTAYRADTSGGQLHGAHVIDKQDSLVVVSY
jgi:protein-L-isoaspartate(D-aspartate) O-methyltransferase